MADRLKAAREAASASYARLDEARRTYRTARTEELLSKDRLRDIIARNEGALISLFPRRKPLVRAFFRASGGRAIRYEIVKGRSDTTQIRSSLFTIGDGSPPKPAARFPLWL